MIKMTFNLNCKINEFLERLQIVDSTLESHNNKSYRTV